MKFILAALFSFALIPTSFADVKPNYNFAQLIDLSIKTGERQDSDIGTFMTLATDKVNSDQHSTQKNYFSSVGFFAENQFHNDHVEVVSETWTTDKDSNFFVDQWIFLLDLNGQILEGEHYTMTETPTRTILSGAVLHPSEYEKSKQWYSVSTALENDLLKK